MLSVKDIIEHLGLKVCVSGDLGKKVTGCYISDLLSDVMANSNDGEIWITLQTHPNVVAVSVIKGLAGIILTNGRTPESMTIEKAEAEKVIIMTTAAGTFETAGLLYNFLKGEH